MAEEQFTSRRARREAERQAAERAFEAREVPDQPQQAPNSRADLLSPPPAKKPDSAPASRQGAAAAEPVGTDDGESATSRIDPDPSPRTSHERGALASDHPQESRPPVHAEDRLDPQRTPLPHFESRAEKKRYLREHGLSLNGDLSTGALPVVADDQELAERRAASEGRLTGPVPEVSEPDEDRPTEDGSAEPASSKSPSASSDSPASAPSDNAASAPSDNAASAQSESVVEHESYDSAGFGGATEEVAARDFEAPVTRDSAPRPTTRENEPFDALSMPFSALDEDAAEDASSSTAPSKGESNSKRETAAKREPAATSEPAPNADPASRREAAAKAEPGTGTQSTAGAADSAKSAPGAANETAAKETELDEAEPAGRARRMPIVQPPSTSGVRVVTAASAQIPTTDEPVSQAPTAPSNGTETAPADGAGRSEANAPSHEPGSDDAARALAANPETRPMDAVPEAWALPNTDYEDEETENPPGTRIRASSVTGADGQILMGEEPSKMPYIVLGIAAFFAIALIVVAFILFQ
ncbi:hypothetical protein [Brevibacterium spongiae]|uniref:Uncharacterized protein n=1 Tax=Brevibacterium spongiae TaxID=2909672 RepID=A0ABY5SYD1_9MICO|nr:hypothetical protein [Brevibacterium spongiae]UVI37699.1 hypothetical protein L1F31_08635 [Brevibacterium spongiae]